MATGQEPPTGQGQSPWPSPGRQGLPIWVCSRRGLFGGTGTWEDRLLFPENQALVVGWHVHLGEMLWLEKLPLEKPPMTPALPTYHSLQEQATGLAQVLQESCVPQPPLWVPAAGKEVESWPGNHPAHLPSKPAPPHTNTPSSNLHLRVRSKSTLLWGEIFPLTA